MSKREEIRKIVDETAKKMHGYESREAWIEDSTDMILDMLQSAGYIADGREFWIIRTKYNGYMELHAESVKCFDPTKEIIHVREVTKQQEPENPNSWFHESCGQWHDNGPLTKCKEPTTKETMEADRLSVIEAKLEYLLEYALSRIPSRIETLEMMAEWKKLK